MEQIEQLLNKFKDFGATELHLEAGQKPYFATPSGVREISANAIQHKDIVQIISPILTPSARNELIEKPGTEFSHRSASGVFQVSIKKSSLGFNVIVRGTGGSANVSPAAATQPVAAQRPAAWNNTPQNNSPTAAYQTSQPTQQYPPQPAQNNPPQPAQNNPPQPAQTFRQGSSAPQPAMAMGGSSHQMAQTLPATNQQGSAQAAQARIKAAQAAEIDKLFEEMVRMKASDLHICVGMPPMVRHDGEMKAIEGLGVLRPEDTDRILLEIMPT